MLITTLLALFVAPATVFSSPITIKTTYQAYPTDAAGKIDWDAVDWKEVNKYRILDLTLLQSALPPGSHLCVDNMDGRAASGVRVQMWECHGGPEQVWEFDWVTLSGDVFQKNKAKQFRIKRRDADYCLHFDVPGESSRSSSDFVGCLLCCLLSWLVVPDQAALVVVECKCDMHV